MWLLPQNCKSKNPPGAKQHHILAQIPLQPLDGVCAPGETTAEASLGAASHHGLWKKWALGTSHRLPGAARCFPVDFSLLSNSYSLISRGQAGLPAQSLASISASACARAGRDESGTRGTSGTALGRGAGSTAHWRRGARVFPPSCLQLAHMAAFSQKGTMLTALQQEKL